MSRKNHGYQGWRPTNYSARRPSHEEPLDKFSRLELACLIIWGACLLTVVIAMFALLVTG